MVDIPWVSASRVRVAHLQKQECPPLTSLWGEGEELVTSSSEGIIIDGLCFSMRARCARE
jgi:hypothetical protein